MGSSFEGAPVRPTGQGGVTSAPIGGGGTYEVGSSSQQPQQPQPLAIQCQGDLGGSEEHTPRSTLFFDALGVPPHLRPPAP